MTNEIDILSIDNEIKDKGIEDNKHENKKVKKQN